MCKYRNVRMNWLLKCFFFYYFIIILHIIIVLYNILIVHNTVQILILWTVQCSILIVFTLFELVLTHVIHVLGPNNNCAGLPSITC